LILFLFIAGGSLLWSFSFFISDKNASVNKKAGRESGVSIRKESADSRVSEKKGEDKRRVSHRQMPEIGEEYPQDEPFSIIRIIKSWNREKRPARSEKPMLAIIIDDVSNASQIRAIRAIPYPVTPSIFPPSQLSSRSYKLAEKLEHFMVHLPMESASRAFNRMRGTLFVKDNRSTIKRRVEEIRRLFPDAKYINNHTGSVFTSDYKAMRTLYKALREEGFTFIDSRTSSHTKVGAIAKSFGDRYIARDVFLDNRQSVPYILSQLKKAVAIAKKRGYAIAIGHPHKATMEALKRAKRVLKGVEAVYIDELFR
jgi:polysaccharide deacetylase 2 family uncharacterized protein YibQ